MNGFTIPTLVWEALNARGESILAVHRVAITPRGDVFVTPRFTYFHFPPGHAPQSVNEGVVAISRDHKTQTKTQE